jgi:hypothetical protein
MELELSRLFRSKRSVEEARDLPQLPPRTPEWRSEPPDKIEDEKFSALVSRRTGAILDTAKRTAKNRPDVTFLGAAWVSFLLYHIINYAYLAFGNEG